MCFQIGRAQAPACRVLSPDPATIRGGTRDLNDVSAHGDRQYAKPKTSIRSARVGNTSPADCPGASPSPQATRADEGRKGLLIGCHQTDTA